MIQWYTGSTTTMVCNRLCRIELLKTEGYWNILSGCQLVQWFMVVIGLLPDTMRLFVTGCRTRVRGFTVSKSAQESDVSRELLARVRVWNRTLLPSTAVLNCSLWVQWSLLQSHDLSMNIACEHEWRCYKCCTCRWNCRG